MENKFLVGFTNHRALNRSVSYGVDVDDEGTFARSHGHDDLFGRVLNFLTTMVCLKVMYFGMKPKQHFATHLTLKLLKKYLVRMRTQLVLAIVFLTFKLGLTQLGYAVRTLRDEGTQKWLAFVWAYEFGKVALTILTLKPGWIESHRMSLFHMLLKMVYHLEGLRAA